MFYSTLVCVHSIAIHNEILIVLWILMLISTSVSLLFIYFYFGVIGQEQLNLNCL